MPRISILKRNKLKRIFRFGFFASLIFTLIFYIDADQFRPSQLALGFVFGVLIGVLEDMTSNRRYSQISLPLQFLIKILGIVIITFGTMSLGVLFFHFHDEDIRSLIQDKELTNPLFLAFIVSTVIMTYFQTEKLVGKKMLINYLKGRYKKPKKEIRVFMFLDLKSSTTLAEKLGNDTYYSFLNDAIYEMSESIIETNAEIYQYVGDEIVFTWPLEKGITDNNCLQLYEKINEQLQKKKSHFLKNYGYQPKFKAALHAGIVLAAEIGHIKKDIVYSGDVLNATSRMESLCNEYEADLLISKSLFNLLDKKHELLYEDIGAISLKGKDEKLELIKIHAPGTSFKAERAKIERVLKGE